MSRFEYVAVNVDRESSDENALTARLNGVAEHGWRLVGFVPRAHEKFGKIQAVFEREAGSE